MTTCLTIGRLGAATNPDRPRRVRRPVSPLRRFLATVVALLRTVILAACAVALLRPADASEQLLARTQAADAHFEHLASTCLPAADACLHAWRVLDQGLGLAATEGEIHGVVQSLSDAALFTPVRRLSEMGGVGDARYQGRTPALATLPDRFVIAWVGNEPGVAGRRVYVRSMNAATGGLGVVRRISSIATDAASGAALDDRAVTLACRPLRGDCIAVWARHTRPDDLLSTELVGRVIDGDGRTLGEEFAVSGMGAAQGSDRYAAAAVISYLAANDRYLAAWDGRRGEPDGRMHAYVASLPGAGGSASPTVRVTTSTENQSNPALLAQAGGARALLAWSHGYSEPRIAPWDAAPAPVGASQSIALVGIGTLSLTSSSDGRPLLLVRSDTGAPSLWLQTLQESGQPDGEARLLLPASALAAGEQLRGTQRLHAVDVATLRVIALTGPPTGTPGTMSLLSLDRRLDEFAFASGFE